MRHVRLPLMLIPVILTLLLVPAERSFGAAATTTYNQTSQPYYEVIGGSRYCGIEVTCARRGGNVLRGYDNYVATLIPRHDARPTLEAFTIEGEPLSVEGRRVEFESVSCSSVGETETGPCKVIHERPAPHGMTWAVYKTLHRLPQVPDARLAFRIRFSSSDEAYRSDGAVWLTDNSDELYGDRVSALIVETSGKRSRLWLYSAFLSLAAVAALLWWWIKRPPILPGGLRYLVAGIIAILVINELLTELVDVWGRTMSIVSSFVVGIVTAVCARLSREGAKRKIWLLMPTVLFSVVPAAYGIFSYITEEGAWYEGLWRAAPFILSFVLPIGALLFLYAELGKGRQTAG